MGKIGVGGGRGEAGNEIIQSGPQVREAFEKLQFGVCKQGGIPNPEGVPFKHN